MSTPRFVCRACSAVVVDETPKVCARCGAASWAWATSGSDGRLLLRLLLRQMGILQMRRGQR